MPAVSWIPLLTAFLAFLVCSASVAGAASNGRTPAFTAEALLLIDPDGKVIFEKNAENDRAPASLV